MSQTVSVPVDAVVDADGCTGAGVPLAGELGDSVAVPPPQAARPTIATIAIAAYLLTFIVDLSSS
jgi:hypothetical protein